jgi:cellular nucleic acid-binding protein
VNPADFGFATGTKTLSIGRLRDNSSSRHSSLKSHKIHASSCSPTNAGHATQPLLTFRRHKQTTFGFRCKENMPATIVEEWLQSAAHGEEPPHRCRKIVREWATEDGAYVTCCADDGTEQTHLLVAMSSLSRRACYKCGNVGHYAEVCASAERLCYNCKFNLDKAWGNS